MSKAESTKPIEAAPATAVGQEYILSESGMIHRVGGPDAPDKGARLSEEDRHILRDSVTGDPQAHPLCRRCFDGQDDPADARAAGVGPIVEEGGA